MRNEALLTDESSLALPQCTPPVADAAAAAQLRADAIRLLLRSEREKSQLARTIHDELAQSLTAVSLELSIWKTELAAGRSMSPEEILEKISELSNQLGGAIHCTKAVSGKLRSRVLEEFGLSAALESQLEAAKQRTGLACHFSSDSEADGLDLNPFLAAQIHQLAGEVIECRAQAGARSLRVRLLVQEDALVLIFEDDGSKRRLTPEVAARLRLLGGELRLDDQQRSIQITLPMQVPE